MRFALLVAAVGLASCGVPADDGEPPVCPAVKPGRVVAPGLSGRIGYISNGGGGGHCYGAFIMNGDGSGARRVTASPLTIHFYADWSPEGQQLAFAGDCNDTDGSDLCLVNGDGSGARILVSGPAVSDPAWSPDGRRIAFSRRGEGERQIDLYTINVDGTDERRLTDEPGQALAPTWSPDGAWIAFTIYRGSKQIFKVPSSGGRVIPLSPGGQINEAPSWSHDGRRLAFASDRSGKPPSEYMVGVKNSPGGAGLPDARAHDIFVMNADGTNIARLTDDPSANRSPTWSPDDQHIAFVSDRHGTYLIYAMRADGSGQVRLSRHAGDSSSPHWIR